jgi:histidinol dehydrogenase
MKMFNDRSTMQMKEFQNELSKNDLALNVIDIKPFENRRVRAHQITAKIFEIDTVFACAHVELIVKDDEIWIASLEYKFSTFVGSMSKDSRADIRMIHTKEHELSIAKLLNLSEEIQSCSKQS